ncbi:hypothetical protein EYR40_009442 [Pleurotus pulmonarius]|nr:hypothetical protein EYR38_009457 [Pleurotus pulmonarius]KAF4590845.1 hypothetical protein EYR40_009442 [Pleurotus pulmonarius]
MAQYYRPRGEHSPLQPSPAAVIPAAAAADTVLDDLELGGIYIFPNPSSAPHSPSQYSDISAPTDFSYSGLSEPRSRDVSPNGRSPSVPWDPSDAALSLTTKPDAFADGDADYEGSVWHMVSPDSALAQRHHWELVLQQRASRHRLRVATEGPEPSALLSHRSQRSQSPHPRIHIPLLSYLVSLFALDDETLHLLQHSSPQSVLFPGARSEAIVGDDENLFDMRVTKLLKAVDSDRAYHSIKEGFGISYQSLPTSATHTFPLTEFIPFISKLITNGGKALYEVFQK